MDSESFPERKMRVDASVAFESGLCQNCGPKTSVWQRLDSLFWLKAFFILLLLALIGLIIAAMILVNKQQCANKSKSNRSS